MTFNPWNLQRSRENDFIANKILLKKNSIIYASQSWTLVVQFFQMYNIKMWKQDFLRSFASWQMEKFLWKLSDIAFFYLLCTMMIILFLKNIDQIMRYKVGQCWSSWAQVAKFFRKRNFLVNLNIKFMYQLHPIMLTKIS